MENLRAWFYIISDREDLKCSDVLEKMEIELYLALKCQFLLNHTDSTSNLFPKIVEIICSIRAITTLYMDDIMNSKVEVDDTNCWQWSTSNKKKNPIQDIVYLVRGSDIQVY